VWNDLCLSVSYDNPGELPRVLRITDENKVALLRLDGQRNLTMDLPGYKLMAEKSDVFALSTDPPKKEVVKVWEDGRVEINPDSSSNAAVSTSWRGRTQPLFRIALAGSGAATWSPGNHRPPSLEGHEVSN
jgi:hypothetical protein